MSDHGRSKHPQREMSAQEERPAGAAVGETDRVLDELFASECPHESSDEMPCRECTRAALAVADERGFLRCREEAAQFAQAEWNELRAGSALNRELDARMRARAAEAKVIEARIRALVPRDSEKGR